MDSTASSSTLPLPSSSTSALTPALFKRLHPKAYLEKFLTEGVRPDGRPLGIKSDEIWREASANLGSISTAPSSSLIRLGNTTVVCGVTLEIAPPEIATPNNGFIVPNIDLSPLCSPLFRPGAPSDESQVLATRLRDIILSSNVLPLSSLIIEASKAAFVVYLDVVCLNFDGGVLDAAVLACISALSNLVLPQATWDPDTNTTTCETISDEFPGKTLSLGALPLSITFGFFNGQPLPDPTLFESELCTSHLTIALLSNSTTKSIKKPKQSSQPDLLHIYQAGAPLSTLEITSLEKGGDSLGVGGGKEVLKQCIQLARERARELCELLQEEVEEE